MKKKVSVAVLIIAFILCCIVPVIGETYGLFEETVSMQNHLVAGSLKATLVRQRLITRNIDGAGNLTTVTDEQEKDFTSSVNDNIFGVSQDMSIVPGSSFTAEMKITNIGDVAFYYYVEVLFNSMISDSVFASMLKLSVSSEKGVTKEILIKDGLTLGEDEHGLGLVEVGASEAFTVKLEFTDSADNNNAENKFVLFDLRVHAIQNINTN